jgi:opacity protein-like surface antigen
VNIKECATLALLSLLLGCAAAARAETFIMKNGIRFEGRIMSATTDYLGVSVRDRMLDIRQDSIRRIDYEPDWDGRSVRLGERVIKAGLGGVLPLTSYGFNRVANGGIDAGVELLVHLKPHWDLGLRMDDMGFSTSYPRTAASDGKAQVQAAALLFEGRWVARPDRRLSPFLVGGLGVNLYSEEIEITPKPGYKWTDTNTGEMREIDDNSAGLAAMLGGGVQVLLSRSYVADFEACWHYWGISGGTFGNSMQSSSYVQAVSLLARLGWRF